MIQKCEAAYEAMLTQEDRAFDPGKLRLSESGFDPRYRLAKALGLFSPTFDLATRLLFWFGHRMETDFLDQLERQIRHERGKHHKLRKCHFEREAPVVTPWGDEGHMDAYLPKLGRVIEVKTIGDFAKIPLAYNVFQVQAYLGYKSAKDAILVYISRKGEGIKSFPVKPDEAIQDEIHEVLKRLHEGIQLGKMQPDSLWDGIDLSKYRTPMDFVAWARDRADYDFPIDIDPAYQAHLQTAQGIANQILEARAEEDAGKEKKLKEQLIPYWADLKLEKIETKEAVLTGSLRITDSLNLKESAACGHTLPDYLQPFRDTRENWVTMVKMKK